MVKRILVIAITLFSICLGACSNETQTLKEEVVPLEIKTLWKGFIVTPSEKFPPLETFVFLEEKEWVNFAHHYFPTTYGELTILDPVDFTEYAIIYTGLHGARSLRTYSTPFKGYTLVNGMLTPVLDRSKERIGGIVEPGMDNYTEIWYITIDVVKKDTLPDGIQNIYEP